MYKIALLKLNLSQGGLVVLHHGWGSQCNHREKKNGSRDRSMVSFVYVEQLSLSFDLGYDQNNSEYIFVWILFLKDFSQGNIPEENLLIDCLKINEVNDCCDIRGKDFIFSVYSKKLVTFCDKVTCSLHQVLSYKDQVQDGA